MTREDLRARFQVTDEGRQALAQPDTPAPPAKLSRAEYSAAIERGYVIAGLLELIPAELAAEEAQYRLDDAPFLDPALFSPGASKLEIDRNLFTALAEAKRVSSICVARRDEIERDQRAIRERRSLPHSTKTDRPLSPARRP